MINRKKKRDYSEIEELLSDNKKATEIFKRIQKREEQAQKKSLLVALIMLMGIILGILVLVFCMYANVLLEIVGILSFDSYVPFRLCNTIFTRKKEKHISLSFDFK